nr:EAL domain-containing protein [Maliibacterium massiliense]
MKKRRINQKSIMRTLLVPLLVVTILQASLFVVSIMYGGVLDQLNHSAFDILNERVINRRNDLQNEMVQRWSNVGEAVESVNGRVADLLAERGATHADITPNSPLATDILGDIANDVVYLLRRNSVTGAFVILNGRQALPEDGSALERSGIYLRDLDPASNPRDTSDLLIERAPSVVTQQLGISTDTWWEPQFHLTADTALPEYRMLHSPLQAAADHPGVSYADLGYWSMPFVLSGEAGESNEVLTYSVPLLAQDGTAYGVLGVEVSTSYLQKLLPAAELEPEKHASYLLAVTDDAGAILHNVVSSGPLYIQAFGEKACVSRQPQEVYNHSFVLEKAQQMEGQLYGNVQALQLYNSNTPFEGERWVLVGIMSERSLLGFSSNLRTTLWIAVSAALLLGIMGVLVVSRWMTRPIVALARKVRASDPSAPVMLEATHISEIDALSRAIESLSSNVASAASRLSTIIEMSGTAIGAFEYDKTTDKVFCTARLYELLRFPEAAAKEDSIEMFRARMQTLRQYCQDDHPGATQHIYRLPLGGGQERWVRLKLVEEETRTLGVCSDITQEMLEKRKIEYERDYDLLTNLYNRRAFQRKLSELLAAPQKVGVGALIMLDLDNLKYINDTYGHDYGDAYIRCAADVLKAFDGESAIVSRMSGDEFLLFFHGFESQARVRVHITQVRDAMRAAALPLPGGQQFKVRASAGVAWYPQDAATFEQLLRYADFAMYKVKNTTKGEFTEFDIGTYNQESYLLHSKEELNRLLDELLVNYHFQPIVSASTGEVFAYEALMRSKLHGLKSPNEILTLARSQSKLYQIEYLTWFKAMEAFSLQDTGGRDVRLFINSVANQILTPEDIAKLEGLYLEDLRRVVVELTEGDKLSGSMTDKKRACIRRWHAKLALDDFGTGYNGDLALLDTSPDFVKIDMSIVRHVDVDENRRKLMANLISYAQERGIKVIAEGVETYAEMETLVLSGVDYLQGYYVGMPVEWLQDVSPARKKEIIALHTRRMTP